MQYIGADNYLIYELNAQSLIFSQLVYHKVLSIRLLQLTQLCWPAWRAQLAGPSGIETSNYSREIPNHRMEITSNQIVYNSEAQNNTLKV